MKPKLRTFLVVTAVAVLLLTEESRADDSSDLTCVQCIGGDFVYMQGLFQDSTNYQSMGWVDQWTGTDCLTTKVNYYKGCKTTCLIIRVQNLTTEIGTDNYNAIMFDCADDLIYATPDIPSRKPNFRASTPLEFTENVTYSNDRSGYRIFYEFTTISSKSVWETTLHLRKVVNTETTHEKTKETNVLYIAIICIVIFCVLSWIYSTSLCVKKTKRKVEKLSSRNDIQDRTQLNPIYPQAPLYLAPPPPKVRAETTIETNEVIINAEANSVQNCSGAVENRSLPDQSNAASITAGNRLSSESNYATISNYASISDDF